MLRHFFAFRQEGLPGKEGRALKLIFRYMGRYKWAIFLGMFLKFSATLCELMLPRVLEHILDYIVPGGDLQAVFRWGIFMVLIAVGAWLLNVNANRKAVDNAHNVSYDVRQDLFRKTANLSGRQFDSFGLPSLISRMTSDSYNVQNSVRAIQTLCIRAPIMLLGGIIITLTMDVGLAMLLCIMFPILLLVSISVSRYGIPLYRKVQERLDDVVRVMRENITGVRVIRALSKSDYERRRFQKANDDMMKSDIKASTIMALPSPFMQLCLNVGLSLVVIIGARRVNDGLIETGVITAFLVYFNMVLQGVMGLNRIFMMLSRASASANRIDQVIQAPEDQPVLSPEEVRQPHGDEFIRFEHVNFTYNDSPDDSPDREQCLYDIDFAIKKGESLGIIGPTGCGKTTIINLLMRFYDVEDGGVFVDGKDVRSYDKDELHRKFGVAFQNDMVFHNSLRENIRIGRELDDDALYQAVEDAVAAEYIDAIPEGLDYQADIQGANLSGGQRQRLLVARALAGNSEILILDDSSSALDYKTDAALRKAIFENHGDSTTILVAQRVSSVQNMTNILVMDDGRCIGYGTHQHLLETCPAYREIYETQMGAMAEG